MLGSCEYMPQELFECYSQSCEIYPVDEDEVPGDIMAKDSEEHEFELDGWARWDMPSEDYYDTDQFPEVRLNVYVYSYVFYLPPIDFICFIGINTGIPNNHILIFVSFNARHCYHNKVIYRL